MIRHLISRSRTGAAATLLLTLAHPGAPYATEPYRYAPTARDRAELEACASAHGPDAQAVLESKNRGTSSYKRSADHLVTDCVLPIVFRLATEAAGAAHHGWSPSPSLYEAQIRSIQLNCGDDSDDPRPHSAPIPVVKCTEREIKRYSEQVEYDLVQELVTMILPQHK